MNSSIQHTILRRPRRRISIFSRLLGLAGVARQRRRLKDLDDHMLRDIGVSRSQAEREARKAPWDVPDHWTQ